MNIIGTVYKNIIQHVRHIINYKLYPLKLDSYSYDFTKQTYTFIIRSYFKRAIIKYSIEDIDFNQFKSICEHMNPIDSFLLGKISMYYKNNIIIEKQYNYKNNSNYIIPNKIKLIAIDYINQSFIFEHSYSTRKLKLKFNETYHIESILQSIDSCTAFKVGQIVANNFLQTSVIFT
jgi:hypothetical protein